MNLELLQMKRFLAIIEHGSFSEAARHLFLTQQALSTSIARLEESLDVVLFERSPGGKTSPTLYGQTLVKHAHALLDGERRAVQDLIDMRDAAAGEVVIGVGEVLAGQIVAEAVARIHAQRPDIGITLVEGYSDAMNDLLLKGDVDFVAGTVAHDATLSKYLVHEHLFDRWDVVAARKKHPLANQRNLGLEHLQDYSWIVPRSNPYEYRVICETFITAGLEPPPHFIRSDTISVGLSLLRNENYLIMTSPVLLGPQFGNPLKILEIDQPTMCRSAGLTYRRHTLLSPAAEALLQLVREAASRVADQRS
jgi:DNA-binding transcriptional LysR family regulator